jgi:hypothetical protein
MIDDLFYLSRAPLMILVFDPGLSSCFCPMSLSLALCGCPFGGLFLYICIHDSLYRFVTPECMYSMYVLGQDHAS